MKNNPNNMRKEEILARFNWKCPLDGHSNHNGWEHPKCYEDFVRLGKVNIGEERIALCDIEAEDLNADYGIMFCWYLMDLESEKLKYDVINLDDIKKHSSKDRNIQPKEDSRILKSFVEEISKYTKVVFHYGSGYDLPFTRTRALICNVDYPKYGQVYQIDTWRILKTKFKLRRNSQENATLKLLGKTRKDHLSLSIKHGCLRGEKWALDITLNHCKNDVLDLRDLFKSIYDYVKHSNTSI